jgi:hypothetical protein
MKFSSVAVSTILMLVGLAIPVIAQLQRPSQDFFNQGRDQLEREIQVIQNESSNSPQNPQKSPSEPILEISPTPTSDASGGRSHRNQQPLPLENPSPTPTPNQMNNSR